MTFAVLVALPHLGCTAAAPPTAQSSGDRGAPVTTVEVQPPPPGARPGDGDRSPDRLSKTPGCRCDVLGFEADGPPSGQCDAVTREDGTVVWTGRTSTPRFTARLTPIARSAGRAPRAVDYVYEAELDLDCEAAWCGRQTHSVLQVAEGDFRVVVERSDDGPPSRVLWFTCSPR